MEIFQTDNTENTEINTIPAKTLLIRSRDTRWFGTDYNLNLYRGCIHGCLYCDSRSDCYQITNFDEVVFKADALSILEGELARKVKKGMIATGAMSDPYNPYEAKLELTRNSLKLIDKYQFGAAIATKSKLIRRDIDILSSIRAHSPVLAKITITTLDDSLASLIEPAASSSAERFAALESLSDAGIYCGILLMPILPYLNDTPENIAGIVRRAAECGARFIYPSFGVTMRSGQREYMLHEMDRLFPDKMLSKLYMQKYGLNYYCASPRSEALWQLFTEACSKYNIAYDMPEIIKLYREDSGTSQLSFM